MSELLFTPEKSFLYVSGRGPLLYRPGSFAALSGKLLPGKMPVPSGSWFSYPARYFQPDRFRMKYGELDGELWLGSSRRHSLAFFSQPEEVFAVTEKILCCPLASRKDSFLLRVLPGSLKKALSITRCLPEKNAPVCMAAAAPALEIKIEEGEELQVRIESLIAWSGCARPRSFCPKLRWRDLFLPRLPQNLVLTFRGPGSVWLEPAEDPLPRRRGRSGNY